MRDNLILSNWSRDKENNRLFESKLLSRLSILIVLRGENLDKSNNSVWDGSMFKQFTTSRDSKKEDNLSIML